MITIFRVDLVTTTQINPCYLCPRACGALREEGQRGVCGASSVIEAARAALHFWEEPPISGESGSGTVFFAHCPLHCVYCQNHELSSGEVGFPVTEADLARAFSNLQEQGALNINLVTATQYAPQVMDAIETARAQGFSLPVVWNTSGYETVDTIQALKDTVDIYLTDYKYASSSLATRYSNASDYSEVAIKALRAMVDQVGEATYDEYLDQRRMTRGVIVRHMLLPGQLKDSKEALERLFDAFGNSILYSIMNQYTPLATAEVYDRFPELADTVDASDYEELLDYADELGISDYFYQEGGACEESFVPEWNGEGLVDSWSSSE